MALIGWACETGGKEPEAQPTRAPNPPAEAPINPRTVPSPQADPHRDDQYDVEFHAEWEPPGLTMHITWTVGSNKGGVLPQVWSQPFAHRVPGASRGDQALLTVRANEAKPSYIRCWITARNVLLPDVEGPFTNPGEAFAPESDSCNAAATVI